jgi:hypothetical protein
MGFRCFGSGRDRSCVDRRADAGPFHCEGGRCVQRHPRVPDVNEWSCADAQGAALCLETARVAGVVPGAVTPGFLCGERRVRGKPTGERLCLDWSPDFPNGKAGAFSCHYEGEPSLQRICVERPNAALGVRCESSCDRGLRCTAGRCLPASPKLECWLDTDCQSGQCRFGTCVER